MSFGDRFEIAGGSVSGRSHVLAGRGNQDAYHWSIEERSLVAVVCDGCGSGAESEVGAAIGARLLVAVASRAIALGGDIDSPALWEEIRRSVLERLSDLVAAMGGKRSHVVSEMFLFTVVGLAVGPARAVIFAAGDGLFAVGADVERLGPFPRNEPPYLGYGLLDEDPLAASSPRVLVHRSFAASELDTVLLGTDGAADLLDLADRPMPGGEGESVGPLRRFWEEGSHFTNRDAVRRRLARINREIVRPVWSERRLAKEPGLLEDDTTIVVVRRRRGS
jgi:protein phosphatase 2C-like protein